MTASNRPTGVELVLVAGAASWHGHRRARELARRAFTC